MSRNLSKQFVKSMLVDSTRMRKSYFVELFLECGANVPNNDVIDILTCSPRSRAYEYSLEYLSQLDKYLTVEVLESYNKDLLLNAFKNRYYKTVYWLLKLGVKAKDEALCTQYYLDFLLAHFTFHKSEFMFEDMEMFENLIKMGANPNSHIIGVRNALEHIVLVPTVEHNKVLRLYMENTPDLYTGWILKITDYVADNREDVIAAREQILEIAVDLDFDLNYVYEFDTYRYRKEFLHITERRETFLSRCYDTNNTIIADLAMKLGAID